ARACQGGVGGAGARARLDRAEKGGDELRAVEQEHQHTLFGPDAEPPYRAAETVDVLAHLFVRDLAIAALDRNAVASSDDDVAVDEVGGDVEGLGDCQGLGVHVGPRWLIFGRWSSVVSRWSVVVGLGA